MSPLGEIAEVMREYPDVVFLVDAVSSLAGVKIEVDSLGIDVCLAGVQKCLALPPGLAVFSVSEKAFERAKEVDSRGYYFDFLVFEKYYADRKQTPTTPVITLIYGLNRQLDDNTIPDLAYEDDGPLVGLVLKGVRPVVADRDRSMLAAAVRDHVYNWDVHQSALRFAYRDDRIPYEWNISIDTFSPHTFVKDLDASGTAVDSYSGWFDGGYSHAAIKRHLTLTNPKNRLILGPWDHGGSNWLDNGIRHSSTDKCNITHCKTRCHCCSVSQVVNHFFY